LEIYTFRDFNDFPSRNLLIYMYIHFSVSNESKALKNLVNSAIDATSVLRHQSSSQSIKETTITGKVADNHIDLYL